MAPTVGIDASRYTTAQRTGTEHYSHELIQAIGNVPSLPFDVRLYTNRIDDQSRAELAAIGSVVELPAPRLWTHGRLSIELQRNPPDLLFVPSHVIPLRHPKSVVTIHDLGYLHEPDAHPPRQRLMLDKTTRWNAKAAGIIAISETTKADLIEQYQVDPDRIRVIHHGVNPRFQSASPEATASLRQRLRLPDSFVLAVGTVQPRKNLGRLAEAVASIENLHLVTAGKPGWMADQVFSAIRSHLGDGRWIDLGYVPDSDLPTLLTAADVVALVSTYEGFGMPVIEAMACGTPVLVSDTPALVEIAGGAARVADRLDPTAIAAGLRSALTANRATDSLVTAGRARAATFTWDRTARETIGYLGEILGG